MQNSQKRNYSEQSYKSIYRVTELAPMRLRSAIQSKTINDVENEDFLTALFHYEQLVKNNINLNQQNQIYLELQLLNQNNEIVYEHLILSN